MGFLLSIGAVGAISYFNRLYARRFDGLLERVEAEFRELAVEAEDPARRFDGRTATIVDERREYLERTMQTVVRVQRWATNEHGEYFFFISEGAGRPYFKHVEQRNARLALGKRYRAPAPSTSA